MYVFVTCAVVVYAVLTAWAATGNNGDLMYLESLYHHHWVLGQPWSTFAFTEALFLFPDFVIYAPLRALLGGQPAATAAFYLISLIVTLALFARLCRRAGVTERGPALWIFVMILSLVPRLNLTLFWPNHHGVLLPVAFATLLTGDGAWALAALIVGTALTTLSDGLSFVQVTLPIFTFWLWRRRFTHAFALGLGAAQGLVTLALIGEWRWLRVHVESIRPTAADFKAEFNNIVPVFGTWSRETWAFHLALGLIILSARRLKDRRSAWDRPFALMIGVTVIATLAMARLTSVYALRYVQNYFFLAAAGVAMGHVPALLARFKLVRRALPFVILALAWGGAGWAYGRGLKFFDRQLATCVEAVTLDRRAHGLGGFWPAKLATFTGSRVVNQVTPRFTKYLWMNSESWYHPGATFVIPDDVVTGDLIRRRFGDPARVVPCGSGETIYLYPNGLAEPPYDPD